MRPASVFTDHMVLQRSKPVPVWGDAEPGATVIVEFAGQKRSAVASDGGEWRVDLDPMPASSRPRKLQVSSSEFQVSFADVLVGDVWLASGQSNMEMSMMPRPPWHEGVLGYENEIDAADYPEIRLLKVARSPSWKQEDFLIGSWRRCSPESVQYFSGVAYYYARKLYLETGVPQGVLLSAHGGTPLNSWRNPQRALQFEKDSRKAKQNQETVAANAEALADYDAQVPAYRTAWLANPDPTKVMQPKAPFKAYNFLLGGCYNGMLAAAAPFAMSGVIWTQGESDAGSDVYAEKLADFVEQFREEWNDETLFFFYSQLANHDPFIRHPDRASWGHYWAKMRNIQLKALRMTRDTGMAVAADVGETDRIHPRDKKTVGERLALWALAKTYGQDVVCSGPLARGAGRSGSSAVVDFDFAGPGFEIRNAEKLEGFELAGEDGEYVPALATVKGDQIVVSAAEVTAPTAVRYAWDNDPVLTLYNKAGLPASPFELNVSE